MPTDAQEKFYVAVKTELIRRRETTVSLAKAIGKSRTAVSQAIHSKGCPRVREQICIYLGIKDD